MNQGFFGWSAAAPSSPPYINIQDQKASGTNGGTFTNGADRTRDLNTIVADTAGIALLASNQLTLPAGTYLFHIEAPGQACSLHQALLFNVTDGATVQRGTSSLAVAASSAQTNSTIRGRVAIAGPRTFEVRHRCASTKTTDGFGAAASFGTEIYTVAEFWKLS